MPPSDNAAASTAEVVTPSIEIFNVASTKISIYEQTSGTGVTVPLVASVIVAPNATGAIAVGGGNKFRCRDYDEKGFCMRGDLCPYDHGADPVVLEDVELSSMLNYNRPPPSTVVVGGVAAAPVVAGAAIPPPVGPPHLRGPPPSLPPG